MKNNKKALVESTTFISLTLLVLSMSLIAYFFLSGFLESSLYSFDRDAMEVYLKKVDSITQEVMSFDNSSASMSISFNSGALLFQGNAIIYQSLVEYDDSTVICFDSICYVEQNDFERIYLNLSNSYDFSNDLTITPGDYILTFVNQKNASKIKVLIR